MNKTWIHFFNLADYEEEEQWLREKHNDGWKLVKFLPPCFYTFESCTPEDVIYRVDYKNSRQTADYMQMVQDFGWEFFTQCVGWLYFRKPAADVDTEADGELFSDGESRVEMVQRIARTRLIPLTIIFFSCIIPNLINAINGVMGVYSYILTDFFGVMFIIYVYMIIYNGIKLTKIRNRYRS